MSRGRAEVDKSEASWHFTYHLDQDAADDHHAENVSRDVRQLVVARNSQLERDTKALYPVSTNCRTKSRGPCRSDAHLDGHDGDAPGQRADGEVHQGRLGAVGGHNAVDEVRARDEAEEEVGEEGYDWDRQRSSRSLEGVGVERTRCGCITEYLVHRLDLLI
jgi:hypothetical protein